VLICLDSGFRLGQTYSGVFSEELDSLDLLVNIRGIADIFRQIEGVAGGNALGDVMEAAVAQEGVELSFDVGQSLRDTGESSIARTAE
jgi:hypothetical protein